MYIITYVKDLSEMQQEGVAISKDSSHPLKDLFTVGSNNSISFNVDKIPVHYGDDGQTLCVVRGVDIEDIRKCNSITPIGECVGNSVDSKRYEFFSEEDRITYENVRGDLNYTVTLEDGSEINCKKPYMIGVIC